MSICCTVVSLVPFDIREEKPGLLPPLYFLKASDGTTPVTLKVDTATHFVYLDESRGNLQVKNPPDVVAAAVVNDYCSSQLGTDIDSGPALTWFPDDITAAQAMIKYKDILEELKLRQKRWFLKLTQMADDDWKKYHQHNVISNTQRKIAQFIGLDPAEHEWLAPLSIMEGKVKECPHCFSKIDPRATVCAVCSRDVVKSAA